MRNRIVVSLAMVSFLILGFITIWTYRAPSDNTFGLENFYQPDDINVSSPKEVWESYNGSSIFSTKACKTEMSVFSNPIVVNGTVKYWISSNRGQYSYLEDSNTWSLGDIPWQIVGADSYLLPYKAGDYIIAPATVIFINNNTQLLNGKQYLDMYVGMGKQYRLEIRNIVSWWCHIGKTSDRHTKKYGADGDYSTANPGSILGIANESTEVRLWKKNDDGVYDRVSLADYYGFE